MCSVSFRKIANGSVCKMTRTTRARQRKNLGKFVDGISLSTKNWRLDHRSTTCGDVITADQKHSERGKNEMRTQSALIVPDDFTNWIQSYP